MSPRISALGSASVRGGVDVPHARTVTRRIPPILRADACQHDVRLSGYPNRYTMMESALGLNDRLIVSETGAMETVMIGPTIDRSVLGIMVDFAKGLPHYLEPGPWDETALIGVEQRLAETPCRASQRSERVIFPDSKAPELLRMQWMANRPLGSTSGPWTTVH